MVRDFCKWIHEIRNRALAHAFSYMNMMEGWGTGIPRLLKDMETYGLREPEFIDMDSAFRVNLYRAPVDMERAESAGEVPEMPMQYRAVYRYASDNGDITTEDVQRILGIKDRRARSILKEMVDQHLLIRKGASRSTRYTVA